MSPAVMDTPRRIPVTADTSWILLLPGSAMYRSPDGSSATDAGALISAEEAGPPSPELPNAPVAEPVTVYMSFAVIDWPHWVPVVPATSWILLLFISAM